MTISTQISHMGIRARHSWLKLRVHKPGFLKILATLVLAIVVAGGLTAYFYFTKGNEAVTYAEQFNLDIKTYSLNGEVVKVDGRTIVVRVGIVQVENGVSTMALEDKDIIITDATQVSKIKIVDGKVSISAAQASDIQAGKSIAIYTTGDTAKAKSLNADKIEIVEQ